MKVCNKHGFQGAKIHKQMLWKFNVPLCGRTGQILLKYSQTNRVIHQGIGITPQMECHDMIFGIISLLPIKIWNI